MLSIAHVTTGAFIATKVKHPLLAIPLILASHYFLDAVPHWDAGTGLSTGKKTPRQAFLSELPDLFFSFLLILIFFPHTNPFQPANLDLTPYWGGFVALLPDFLEAPKNFLGWEPKLLQPLNRFHHRLHHSIPHRLTGLIPQIILLLFLYLLK